MTPADAREPAAPPATPAVGGAAGVDLRGRARGLLRQWGWMVLAAAGVLVMAGAADFRPPQQVRIDPRGGVEAIGGAAEQPFSPELGNPQAAQVRATLRVWPEGIDPTDSPASDDDTRSTVISQPLATTLLGTTALIEQTVRLEGGALELDVRIEATPRELGGKSKTLVLEHDVRVTTRTRAWLMGRSEQRVILALRGTSTRTESDGLRLVFAAGRHTLSVDLESSRPG